MSRVDRGIAVEAVDAEYRAVAEIAAGFAEHELLEASGCRGWSVADVLFHVLLDAQRALVTFHSSVPGPADTDFVDYWRGFQSDDAGARAHARFVRACVAAHSTPKRIVARWIETSSAACRAAATVDALFVTTQGHVLETPDFVATLVVEATIHHLDLVTNLEIEAEPAAAAVALTTKTLDGLLDAPRPPRWDDLTYLRKATGRERLTDDDRAALGAAACSIPLFS